MCYFTTPFTTGVKSRVPRKSMPLPTSYEEKPKPAVITALRGGVLPDLRLRSSGKADGGNTGSAGVGVNGSENGNINGLCVLESFKPLDDSQRSFDGFDLGEIKSDRGKDMQSSGLSPLLVENLDKSGHGKVELSVEISPTESTPIQPSETNKTGVIELLINRIILIGRPFNRITYVEPQVISTVLNVSS